MLRPVGGLADLPLDFNTGHIPSAGSLQALTHSVTHWRQASIPPTCKRWSSSVWRRAHRSHTPPAPPAERSPPGRGRVCPPVRHTARRWSPPRPGATGSCSRPPRPTGPPWTRRARLQQRPPRSFQQTWAAAIWLFPTRSCIQLQRQRHCWVRRWHMYEEVCKYDFLVTYNSGKTSFRKS